MVTTPHKKRYQSTDRRKKDYLFGYSFWLDGLGHDDGLTKNPNHHTATE
jgi:hypothetical protein